MRAFHVTAVAEAILAQGFRDDYCGYEVDGVPQHGVRIVDPPPEAADLVADVLLLELLELKIPEDEDLSLWELVEDGTPPGFRREWCVPAALLSTTSPK